jgi:hypothetical protein
MGEGETEASITIGVLGDDVSEPSETFTITLSPVQDDDDENARDDSKLQVDSDRVSLPLTCQPIQIDSLELAWS